jgi:hypothetical protein
VANEAGFAIKKDDIAKAFRKLSEVTDLSDEELELVAGSFVAGSGVLATRFSCCYLSFRG